MSIEGNTSNNGPVLKKEECEVHASLKDNEDEINVLISEGFVSIIADGQQSTEKEIEQGFYGCPPCAQDRSGLKDVLALSCKEEEIGSESLVKVISECAEAPTEQILDQEQEVTNHCCQEGTGHPITSPGVSEIICLTPQEVCSSLHSGDQDRVKGSSSSLCCSEGTDVDCVNLDEYDYSNVLSGELDNDKEEIWSILTDDLTYVQDMVKDTALCIQPVTGYRQKMWKLNKTPCPSEWDDSSTWADQALDKYCGVRATLAPDLNPHSDIMTTYLYSASGAEGKSTGEWFE